MGSDHPFQPPSDEPAADSGPGAWTRHASSVLVTWGVCGACVGTAGGATLQLMGGPAGTSGAFGVAGIAAFGVTGGVALALERRSARARPALLDARGVPGKPLHGGLFLVPIGVALPMLLWLVVVGSIAAESLLPAFGFGMLSLAMAWGAAKAWTGHRMARALEALELGRVAEAREALEALEGSLFVSRASRGSARLGLGGVALQAGALGEAERWFQGAQRSGASGFASAGLAMVHLLRNRLEPAETEIQAAMGSTSARQVQEQIDTVRLLLVWRRDGPGEARALGEQLLSPDSGTMFRGLLAELRCQAGDPAGEALLADVRPALYGPLVDLVPELTRSRRR